MSTMTNAARCCDDSRTLISPLQRHPLTGRCELFTHPSLLDVLVCPFAEALHISEIYKVKANSPGMNHIHIFQSCLLIFIDKC